MQKDKWDRHWRNKEIAIAEVEWESKSRLFQTMLSILVNEFQSLKGINIIEVGSGLGTDALLLAGHGAKVTLLDYSEEALSKARELFKVYKFIPTLIQSDIFEIGSRLRGHFDVALSFGLAEHFTGEKRLEVFQAHVDLVRQGGIVAISIPNSLCLPYQVSRFVKRWDEIPFTKSELRRIGDSLGVEVLYIGGFGFMAFVSFAIHTIFNARNYLRLPELPRSLDDKLGYAFLFMARKKLA
jgi:SAM-dependent methyltransferase